MNEPCLTHRLPLRRRWEYVKGEIREGEGWSQIQEVQKLIVVFGYQDRVHVSNSGTFSVDKMVYMKKLYGRRKTVYPKDEKIVKSCVSF